MEEDKPLKILVVASEVAPFAKSGGLGDVTGSLPYVLKNQGVDVRVVLPKYKKIKTEHFENTEYMGSFNVSLDWRNQQAGILKKNSDVTTYFIENDYYFGRDEYYGYDDDNERFLFFCKAVLEMLRFIDFYPDVIHCNDWQTGPLPMLLRENYNKFIFYKNIKTLYTVHNLQYQGVFSRETLGMAELPWSCFDSCEYYGQMNFMKAGLVYCNMISTVSNTYAKEIKTFRYGYGLDGVLRANEYKLCGILNGIDYVANNPKTDSRLVANYDVNSIEKKKKNKYALQKQLGLEVCDMPMISIISRLADQKGLDLVAWISEQLLNYNVQFVILGTGEKRLEDFFQGLELRYKNKVSANIMFDDTLAQRIYASSDIFLMPSLFEPCGLGQMFSLRYGTIPVVRKTGGLCDTVHQYNEVTGDGNGFVFENYTTEGLMLAIKAALNIYEKDKEQWLRIVKNAMQSDNSWISSAKTYFDIYKKIKQM